MSMKISGGSPALSTATRLDSPREKESISREVDQLLAMLSRDFGSDGFSGSVGGASGIDSASLDASSYPVAVTRSSR